MPFDKYKESSDSTLLFYRYYQNSSGPHFFCKCCQDKNKYDEYSASFEKEFYHMHNLWLLMEAEGKGSLYSSLFPRYYSFGQDSNGRPCLTMEYIEGITLEEKLCQKATYTGPHLLLTHRQILHIYKQLHDAFFWLHQGGMLQIDLSPQNILITSSDFTIKLIDFTDCYYMNSPYKSNMIYKKMDWRSSQSVPSLQLRDSAALLFTRLFFSGNEHYAKYFTFDRINRNYFEREYKWLLHCIFYPEPATAALTDTESLLYWEEWYQQLCIILSCYP